MARRRTGLFLVVVLVVVTVLAAPGLAATPTATLPFHFLRRLDGVRQLLQGQADAALVRVHPDDQERQLVDRKSTRLNSSHRCISYAVFCLKKKKYQNRQ